MAMPPLKALHYFAATARHLSFSRAAEELCVTQSAVSHQVRLLEQFMGKPLLLRQGKRVCLTQEGDSLYAVVRDSFQRIESVTGHLLNEPRANLRIVAQTSIAVEWLASRLPLFKRSEPDVGCFLSMESAAASVDTASCDVIIGTWPTPADFVSLPLRDEWWFPVCAPSLAAQISDCASLLSLPLYSSENGEDWRLWLQHQQLREPPQLAMSHFGLALLATKAALQGDGVTLSNHFLAQDLIAAGQLVAYPQWRYRLPWGQYSVHYRQDSHNGPAIEAFVRWLQGQVDGTPSA